MPGLQHRILMIAGEASGDLLGAHLAKAIQALHPNIALLGMGGYHMRHAGVEIMIDADPLAVTGIWEILKHIGAIFSAMRTLKKLFKIDPPNLVIFIDYPGFNLHLAKFAKKTGVKVLYYVSPQIWAWRYGRIKTIKKYIDCMAVLFAFEEKLYQKENMPVHFVGHPIVDIAIPTLAPHLAYQHFHLNPNQPIIALLPGSRRNEISALMPIMMTAVRCIQKKIANAQFVLPLASSITLEDIQPYLMPEIQVIENNTYNLLPLCHAAITASGTATLEIALHNVPMVIIYKIAALSYWLGTQLIRVPFIGLCNLVAEEQVAKELIQKDATAHTIANEIIRLLQETVYRQSICNKLSRVKEKLGGGGGSHKAAKIALDMLNGQHPR